MSEKEKKDEGQERGRAFWSTKDVLYVSKYPLQTILIIFSINDYFVVNNTCISSRGKYISNSLWVTYLYYINFNQNRSISYFLLKSISTKTHSNKRSFSLPNVKNNMRGSMDGIWTADLLCAFRCINDLQFE